MAKTVTSRTGQTRWSSGTDTVRRLDFDTDAANIESLMAIYGQGLLSARPAAGKPGRFYTIVGESDPKLNGRTFYDNGSGWTSPRLMTDGIIESTANGNTALLVKGFTSPSVDIFRVANAADTTAYFKITSDGIVSNQTTVGTSAGVYLGNAANHDASASLISVAADKPVLIVRGASSQTASLIIARSYAGSQVMSLSNAGVLVAAGSITGDSLAAINGITGKSLTVTDSLVAKNVAVTPFNASSPGAVFNSIANHLHNTVEFVNNSGGRVARVTPDGTYATNSRLVVGGNNGALTSTYASDVAALLVTNSFSTAPIARFVANATQSGNLIELVGSGGANRFTVDNNGNMFTYGVASVGSLAVGNNSSPTPFYSGYQPPLEIISGGESESYTQAVVVRHPTNSTNAVSRSLGLQLKLSNEANASESAKWAGLVAVSSLANADSPSLLLYAGGTEAGRFDGVNKSLSIAGSLFMVAPAIINTGGGFRTHMQFSNDGLYGLGLQANTLYLRGEQFALYSGGTHNDGSLNGGGGVALLTASNAGADPRVTVDRLTVKSLNGSTTNPNPALVIGTLTGPHANISVTGFNAYAGASQASNGVLSIQNVGGAGARLVLGGNDTQVELPDRTLFTGGNRVYFGGSAWAAVGGAPINNDWFFDYSNERIMVRRSDNTWKVVAAASSI